MNEMKCCCKSGGCKDEAAKAVELYQQKVARVVRLYQRVLGRELLICTKRGSNRGIAIHNDFWAIQYQQHVQWRKEVLSAWLEGRKPKHEVKRWFTKTGAGKK